MHLLFDLDGTLTDPFEGIAKCINHALTDLGRQSKPNDQLTWCIGPPLKNSFATLLNSDDDELLEKALVLYRERFSTGGLYENKVYPGIPDTLGTLKDKGHLLHVATSKPEVFARRILHHFNLTAFFHSINGSELDGTRSDKKALISHILTSNSIKRKTAVMIGDRKHDIIGATENRIGAIGVLWGYGSREELQGSGAKLCLNSHVELIELFAPDQNMR